MWQSIKLNGGEKYDTSANSTTGHNPNEHEQVHKQIGRLEITPLPQPSCSKHRCRRCIPLLQVSSFYQDCLCPQLTNLLHLPSLFPHPELKIKQHQWQSKRTFRTKIQRSYQLTILSISSIIASVCCTNIDTEELLVVL